MGRVDRAEESGDQKYIRIPLAETSKSERNRFWEFDWFIRRYFRELRKIINAYINFSRVHPDFLGAPPV